MKTLFLDTVKDPKPEPVKSVVLKKINGKEEYVDLKERSKKK